MAEAAASAFGAAIGVLIAMAVVASLFFLLLDQFFKVGLNYLIGA